MNASPKKLLVLGSCRVHTLCPITLKNGSLITSSVINGPPNIYSASTNDIDFEVLTNTTGYGVSAYEFLDLVKVNKGILDSVNRPTTTSEFKEVHKYLKKPIICLKEFDGLVLEVCSSNFIQNTIKFKEISGWAGGTLPYKILHHDLEALGICSSKVYKKMTESEIDDALCGIIDICDIPRKNLFIIGPYHFDKLIDGDEMSSDAKMLRCNLIHTLDSICRKRGFSFSSMLDILGGEENIAQCLNDRYHLNERGVSRVSSYIFECARTL